MVSTDTMRSVPFLILLGVAVACSRDRREFAAAERHFSAGDLHLADSIYRTFIRDHPTSAWRATADAQLKKVTAAQVLLDSVDLLAGDGRLDRAIDTYQRLSLIEPAFFDTLRLARLRRLRDSVTVAVKQGQEAARAELDARIQYLGLNTSMRDEAAIAVVSGLREARPWGTDDWEGCVRRYRADRSQGHRCRAAIGPTKIVMGLQAGQVVLLDFEHYLGSGVTTVAALERQLGSRQRTTETTIDGEDLATLCRGNFGNNVACRVNLWDGLHRQAGIVTADGYSPAGDPLHIRWVFLRPLR